MIKVIVLCAKQADISREQFRQHLEDKHLPQVEQLPGLHRLVINHVLPGPDSEPPAYYAIAEDWFQSAEAMQAAFASPEGQAINADVPNFADPERLHILVVDEHEITSK
jgi:uncharacterized protein (TIGR02118 family)